MAKRYCCGVAAAFVSELPQREVALGSALAGRRVLSLVSVFFGSGAKLLPLESSGFAGRYPQAPANFAGRGCLTTEQT